MLRPGLVTWPGLDSCYLTWYLLPWPPTLCSLPTHQILEASHRLSCCGVVLQVPAVLYSFYNQRYMCPMPDHDFTPFPCCTAGSSRLPPSVLPSRVVSLTHINDAGEQRLATALQVGVCVLRKV